MKTISKNLRKKKKHNKIRLCAYNSPYNLEFVKKVLEVKKEYYNFEQHEYNIEKQKEVGGAT